MKQRLSSLYKNPLISGSAIIFVGSNVASFFNYIFNILVGRFLSLTDYGIYLTLVSVLGLFGIFPSTFNQIFAKFAATFKAKKEDLKLKWLFQQGSKTIFYISLGIFLLLLLSTGSIGSFLHISNTFILLLFFIAIFLSILISVPSGILVGEMRFYALSSLNIISLLVKILVGFLLLFIGWRVIGVGFAFVMSSVISLIVFSFLFRSSRVNSKDVIGNTRTFFRMFRRETTHFFMAALGQTILMSFDMILVKHLMSPVQAGQYGAMSLMGKTIFYFVTPIYTAFFPLIAQKKAKNENVHTTLFLAITIIIFFTVPLSFIYFVFPYLVIPLLFPQPGYRILASYIGPYSLYIIIFSIAMLFNNFLLSMGKTDIYKINLLIAVLFILGFYLFHNSFYQIIGVLFFTSFLLLTLQITFYLYGLYAKK